MNTMRFPGFGSPVTRATTAQHKETGVVPCAGALTCSAAERACAQAPDGKTPAQPGDPEALSARYHFMETYSAAGDPARPELLNQYQVGCRETVKVTREKPQGAPDHDESVLQTIYTERVSKVTKEGLVTEVVRRYDKSNFRTTVEMRPLKLKWLEGLTILYRLQNREMPMVQSLTSRILRQQEYEQIGLQSYLPLLTTIFPKQPSRKGDSWPLARGAAWALIGVQPAEEDFGLIAEVVEIRKNEPGPSMTAVINVKGPCLVRQGPSAINAQVYFTFEPSVPATPARDRSGAGVEPAKDQTTTKSAALDKKTQGVFDARGFINKISLAQEVTTPLPGSDGRFKQSVRREVLLERRKSTGAAPLEIPNPLPEPNEQNSWLLFDEPQGQFHFLHPQELRPTPVPGGIRLLDLRPEGPDMIQINLVPKSQDPQKDRLAADPVQEKKLLEEEWRKSGVKVVAGPAGWLPDAEWGPFKRRVYRIEAGLIKEDDDASPPTERTYMDRYLVQFPRNEVMKVTAMTTRERDHPEFRTMAENIIRKFEFGPSEGSLPTAPSPARPAR